jgi:hypothetical protein
MHTTGSSKRSLLATVLLAGFVAGTLDIIAALSQYYINTGKNPLIVLNYIASAALGKETAYAPGVGMQLVGLAFHYVITYGLTVFFFWLYPRWHALSRSVALTSIAYGLFAWCVTNLVIVPLSYLNKFPSNPKNMLIAALILIFMIGLPLTLFARNYFRKAGSFKD